MPNEMALWDRLLSVVWNCHPEHVHAVRKFFFTRGYGTNLHRGRRSYSATDDIRQPKCEPTCLCLLIQMSSARGHVVQQIQGHQKIHPTLQERCTVCQAIGQLTIEALAK